MFEWMTRRRRMEGGLYFGAPGWGPEKIEGLNSDGGAVVEAPVERGAFREMLREIGLERTSAISPGLLEQMEEIGERRIRALVVNLVPTQPEFALAGGLGTVAMAEMAAGLAAIHRVVRAKRVVVATDRHDWRIRRQWRVALRKHRAIRPVFAKLLNRYPQGHPTLLLWSLFGRRTAVGKLPTRGNRVIVDAVACWGVGRFVRTGKKFDERPVQLFRPAPRLVMGNIGETVSAFCKRHGVVIGEQQVLRNGMLAGEEIGAEALINSETESITVRPRPAPELPTACFSCGWCVDVCPTRLNPINLLELAEQAQGEIAGSISGNWEARESMHCVGCGLCSYVCPTRLPLTQQVLKLREIVQDAMEQRHPGAGK